MPGNRVGSIVLIIATLVASWLGMQAVHELGHVLAARITRGRVANIALHPLGISRTDLAANPHPLAVAWAGPVFGATAPVLAWQLAGAYRLAVAFLLRFFAGFCLVANGLYIGVGSFGRIGDCGEMLRHGAAPWHLWLFAIATVPAGFTLWNGQGAHFGLSQSPTVSRAATIAAVVTAACLVIVGLWIGP
jgi:hypothetical protein